MKGAAVISSQMGAGPVLLYENEKTFLRMADFSC